MIPFIDTSSFANVYILITSVIHLNRIIDNILPLFQFILHTFFSFNMYIVDNKENKIKMLKNMKNYYCYCYDENKDPLRCIVEKSTLPKYFAYIEDVHVESVFVFCRESTFAELLQDQQVKQEIILSKDHIPITDSDEDSDEETRDKECDALLQQNAITYLSFSGSYGHFYINERSIHLSPNQSLHWYDYQTQLFRDMLNFYKDHNYCKVFLSGSPGKGKTFFAYLMAQKLNCYLTDQYNPTDPGSSLNTLYHRAKKVSAKKPLIIVLDEVDVLLSKLHNKEVVQHKHFKSEVSDKTSWNQFLDKVSYGLYPYLMVIMISNKKRGYIEKMDPAYLREGRIDVFQEW